MSSCDMQNGHNAAMDTYIREKECQDSLKLIVTGPRSRKTTSESSGLSADAPTEAADSKRKHTSSDRRATNGKRPRTTASKSIGPTTVACKAKEATAAINFGTNVVMDPNTIVGSGAGFHRKGQAIQRSSGKGVKVPIGQWLSQAKPTDRLYDLRHMEDRELRDE